MIDVAPLEHALGRRQAHLLDVLVDRAVLLDEEVALRDVGLGLVVVVVADEVLDRVLREELAELAVELRRERLVRREDDRRPADLGDHVGHREGLAGAGDAEQRLERQAVADALDQALDRGRLVARRRVRLEELERRAGVRDEFALRLVGGRFWRCDGGRSSVMADKMERGSRIRRETDQSTANASGDAKLAPPRACCSDGARRAFPRSPRTSKDRSMSSLFDAVEMAPRDPILGLNEQFVADPNPAKVNLGVGVYYDENGKLPLLRCVRAAEETMMRGAEGARLPADRRHRRLRRGDPGARVRRRLARRREDGRIATVQARRRHRRAARSAPTCCKRMNPTARVLISDPSWENHRALFEGAGFEVGTYPYYDAGAPGRRLRGDARRARARPRRARSSCCTPAATTRPAAT